MPAYVAQFVEKVHLYVNNGRKLDKTSTKHGIKV